MKKITLLLIAILTVLFFSTCDERVWENPYDPECNSSEFSSSIWGKKWGNDWEPYIVVEWDFKDERIDGVIIKRMSKIGYERGDFSFQDYEQGDWVNILNASNIDIKEFKDITILPGRKYIYSIQSYAESNYSSIRYSSTIETRQIDPVINTINVNSVSSTEILIECKIELDGGMLIKNRGVFWREQHSWETPNDDNHSVDSRNSKFLVESEVDNFVARIDGLKPNTTYYVRSFVEHSLGSGYISHIEYGDVLGITTNSQ
ncbi:hypothetical protein L3073_09455 [Ancylomarina sp. DW003]|nr:hypothetical protein [Ancylomarina sp. DW003]MDE5422431.1 hypothetical protein [Ancylomarina sp. DW003]